MDTGGRRRLSRRRREGGLDECHKNWVNERMECAEGVEEKAVAIVCELCTKYVLLVRK